MESRDARILKTLHAAATDIQDASTVEDACARSVQAAEEILDFELCTILVHVDGWLDPIATSTAASDDGARRMATDQGLAGKTYQTKRAEVVDDLSSHTGTDPAKTDYRSGLSAPVGDIGVFQAVSRKTAAFDQSDLEFVELLLAHTAQTVTRIRYERELRDSRESLERQNERLEDFVHIVSHDLRNPLSVANGYLDLAKEETNSECFDAISNAHQRMEDLITDLLALAHADADLQSVEAVDLATLVETCWQHVDTTDAALDVRTQSTVLADRSRLTQLLENLFRNAVEHTDGHVTIVVDDLDDGRGFFVADDGPGIPTERQDTVFERGFSTTKAGTGFGLAVVQAVADAHDWTLSLTESTSGGARFEFRTAAR